MTPRASEDLSGTKPPVRIAVDMDEVIADYFGEQVARYESWSGAAVDITATEGKRLRECVPPEHREFVSRLPRTPGFFANLKMIEGSRDALEVLSQYGRIYIVSAATEYPNSLCEKFDWLAAKLSVYRLAADRSLRRKPILCSATFSPINLREVQGNLIVEGVQVFRAQRENSLPSRFAEEPCKVDKSFSGS